MTLAADEFIARYQELELLRFMTCGGVDHGKSTLIGRLLFDSRSVPDDHVASARRNTARYSAGSADLDFAMLVDGLRAEREQGITIDVAYRYFRTKKRKFIIADAPGHEQYMRNMATAASNCDLAVVLVDASVGVIEQTRRHTFIAALLGIRHLIIAINKMDLVDRDEGRFDAIRRAFDDFAARLEVSDVEFIPMVASTGENVVARSAAMEWYRGRPLLAHLEDVHIASDRNLIDLRFPVQVVLRGDNGARHLAGTLASGVVRPGDEVSVLPSRVMARVMSISNAGEEAAEAFSPSAITMTLDRDVDVSRGDILAHVRNIPTIARDIEAMVVWMSADAMRAGREYIFQHCTTQTSCTVRDVRYRIDVNELRHRPAAELHCNEIGRVRIETTRRIAFDAYARNRATGAFILIDRMTGATAAAGMIVDRDTAAVENAKRRPPSRMRMAPEAAGIARSLARLLMTRGAAALAVNDGESAEVFLFLERVGVIAIVIGEAHDAVELVVMEGEGASEASPSRITVHRDHDSDDEVAERIAAQLDLLDV